MMQRFVKGSEFWSTDLVERTRADGRRIKETGPGLRCSKMGASTSGSSKITELTAKEPMSGLLVRPMSASGRKALNTDTVFGKQRKATPTKASGSTGDQTAMGCAFLRTETGMKENGTTLESKDKARTSSATATPMKGSMLSDAQTAKVNSSGGLVRRTQESGSMVSATEKVFGRKIINLIVATNTKVNGNTT